MIVATFHGFILKRKSIFFLFVHKLHQPSFSGGYFYHKNQNSTHNKSRFLWTQRSLTFRKQLVVALHYRLPLFEQIESLKDFKKRVDEML